MVLSRTRRMAAVGVLVALVAGTLGAAAAPGGGKLTTEQLIYQGATVEVQVDVDGAGAVQLIGEALDAAATIAKEQGKVLAQGAPIGPSARQATVMAAAMPLIDPAKEAIKSVTRAALVVMKPAEKSSGEAVSSYYSQLMAGQGWLPLMTVKGPEGERISLMLAAEAKGVFLMVQEKKELVVGMITTSQPIGQLIGQIVRAGGGMVPAIIAGQSAQPANAVSESEQPAPPDQPKQ